MGINSTIKTCTIIDYLTNITISSQDKPMCLPACDVIDFSMNIRVSKFDFESSGQTVQDAYGDAAILILYFETFYYDKITEYHESLTDFLCKYEYAVNSFQLIS